MIVVMYVVRVPNRGSPPAVLLRESYREDGKVKHKHVASLGSVWDESLQERERFWIECEDRLARLGNRIGPDLDRLRQTIAVRIPLVTDADRAAMEAAPTTSAQSSARHAFCCRGCGSPDCNFSSPFRGTPEARV